MWKTNYQAPTNTFWIGRADALPRTSFFQAIECIDLRDAIPTVEKKPTFALLGFCCEEGVKRNHGRLGAKEGPDEIRKILGSFPLKRSEILIYDVGNIVCDENQLEEAQLALADVVALLMNVNIIPILLGGGHELAWGHYQGIAKLKSDRLSMVNFDAHFDMRPLLNGELGTSGTPFLQIARDRKNTNQSFDCTYIGLQSIGNSQQLDETANNLSVVTMYADQIHEFGLAASQNLLHDLIDRSQAIYVSLCLDVFASPFAPGVSAPQVLGLMPWQVIALLRELAESKKVVSYDIAEYCPVFDIDTRTAKLAASLIYNIIHHHAV